MEISEIIIVCAPSCMGKSFYINNLKSKPEKLNAQIFLRIGKSISYNKLSPIIYVHYDISVRSPCGNHHFVNKLLKLLNKLKKDGCKSTFQFLYVSKSILLKRARKRGRVRLRERYKDKSYIIELYNSVLKKIIDKTHWIDIKVINAVNPYNIEKYNKNFLNKI